MASYTLHAALAPRLNRGSGVLSLERGKRQLMGERAAFCLLHEILVPTIESVAEQHNPC